MKKAETETVACILKFREKVSLQKCSELRLYINEWIPVWSVSDIAFTEHPKLTSVYVVEKAMQYKYTVRNTIMYHAGYELKFYVVSWGGQFLCQLTIKGAFLIL